MAGEKRVVVRNATVIYEEFNYAPYSNDVSIDLSQQDIDASNFESPGGFEDTLPGNKSATFTVSGFAMSGDLERALWTREDDVLVSFSRERPVEAGDLVYFATARRSGNPIQTRVGQIATLSANFKPIEGIVQGYGAYSSLALTASATGTEINIPGGVPNGSTLKMIVHCTDASGTSPTMDIIVRSAAATGMGTPTTRGTFTQITAAGSELIEVDGPITDEFWDVDITVAGTTPSFGVMVAIGVI